MQKLSDTLSVDERDGVSIIFIQGNLGYETAGDLRKTYDAIDNNRILVDLGNVTLTSSRGMATLLNIFLESEEKGWQLALCNVSGPCNVILEASDILTHVPGLKTFDSLEDGLAFLKGAE